MNDMREIGLDEMRRAYYTLSGLLSYVALVTQGVALGWYITPLRGLRTRSELSDSLSELPVAHLPRNYLV